MSYLRWWKSWNSGEGSRGRWYPLWEMLVLRKASEYHRVVVEMWEPKSMEPTTAGIMLEN